MGRQNYYKIYNELLDKYSMQIMAVVLVITIFTLIINKLLQLRKNKKKENRLPRVKPGKAHGLLFGKDKKGKIVYSPEEDEGHELVVGGSGLGKTTALLLPENQSLTEKSRSWTIDISGDIENNCPNMPNKLVYAPGQPGTIPYNIFAAIDKMSSEEAQNEALQQLVLLLMPEPLHITENARFFLNGGRDILTAALLAFYRQGKDFVEICELICQSSWQQLFKKIDETENQAAIFYINSFEGANEANTAGCKQAADGAINLFATNERIKKTIRRPEPGEESYSAESIEQHHVFINIPDEELELLAPLLHILTAQLLQYLSGRPKENKEKIYINLDEFASLGKLDITPSLRKLRKKNVRIICLTQSVADIDLIYGKDERASMLNNFKYKVLLSASDTDTQRYIAELIGKRESHRRSITKSATQTSRTDAEEKDWAIEPAELDRLGDDLIVLYPGGWERLKKNFWFKKR